MNELHEGCWYWVSDGKSIWPAMRASKAAGGWSNGDTWEDFDREVKQWEEIAPASFALDQPPRIIDNVTEVYIFASNGYVNTAKRGEANTTLTRKTGEIELQVGQRMVIERGDGVMRLEVLPVTHDAG